MSRDSRVSSLFAGSLRTHLRATDGAEGLSAVVLAGAAVLTAGAAVYFGADFVLAMMPATIAPPAAQALNMLALYLVLPLSAGGLVFGSPPAWRSRAGRRCHAGSAGR